jgi:hypothetical protein
MSTPRSGEACSGRPSRIRFSTRGALGAESGCEGSNRDMGHGFDNVVTAPVPWDTAPDPPGPA